VLGYPGDDNWETRDRTIDGERKQFSEEGKTPTAIGEGKQSGYYRFTLGSMVILHILAGKVTFGEIVKRSKRRTAQSSNRVRSLTAMDLEDVMGQGAVE